MEGDNWGITGDDQQSCRTLYRVQSNCTGQQDNWLERQGAGESGRSVKNLGETMESKGNGLWGLGTTVNCWTDWEVS